MELHVPHGSIRSIKDFLGLSTEDRRALIQELRRYKAFAWFLEAIGTDALKICAGTLNQVTSWLLLRRRRGARL
ncbi:MAG TPA: hypothetical protein VIY68_09140 [Steroidobacteraceae bacterium]